jgi:hypothetical protein
MERKSRESEEERTRLHEKIAADLGAKHHPNQDFSEIGSQASAVTGMSQSTDGRNTYRTYDTGEVKGEYFSKSDELLRLTIKQREMDPDENDSKTEEAEARKSRELAATKATMTASFWSRTQPIKTSTWRTARPKSEVEEKTTKSQERRRSSRVIVKSFRNNKT